MKADLTRLQILSAVGRHGSMAAAADELRYTSSAISQQISKLESELGVELVERHARGVRLTEAGRAVVVRARAIDEQLDGMKDDLRELAGGFTGTVRFGVFPTFAASLLPDVVIGLRETHPGIRLSVHSSRIAPLQELLETRQLDLALTWDYPWNRTVDEGLTVREILSDSTVLIVRRDHELAHADTVELSDLSNDDWIVRAGGHPTAEHLWRCAHTAGFRPTVAVEASDYQETQAMVAAGLGVTLCPQLATSYVRGEVVVKRLAASVPPRRICTARPSDVKPSVASLRLEGLLHKVVKGYNLSQG
ncbi:MULTISPECIES: LysR family transcriptional regulator [Rhodococcus]|uniref:LysR family transcriptional regulator n=1 Tax=Rhodococcus cerastii TaxID=908616 RepID=A0ABU4CUD6_9NOCA|nr:MULTISPECIES: LysR family transcriptional regulator [Rhodococcus]MDV6301028.1 LysR family transcriptional regulator [Rhodococcus cerastii]MDV7987446.1 LysR family transcriptional regulator [Rhodococcus sp. IEGM 1374]